MVSVKWSNGNTVTYQVSNGNWIVRDKTGHQIGIYTKGSTTGKYLTRTYISKTKPKTNNSSSNNTSSSSSLDTFGSSDNSESSSTDTADTTNNSSNGQYTTTVEEVEIDNYYEALRFAYKYAHMILRENGHSIDCKVLGGPEWKIGEWCKVNIPTFNEDSTMFISKCSTEVSASDENIATLTLVDYPPSLSSGVSNTVSDSSSTASVDDAGNSSGSEDSDNITSTASTSNNNSNSNGKSFSKTKTSNKSKSKTKNSSKNLKGRVQSPKSVTGTKYQSNIGLTSMSRGTL